MTENEKTKKTKNQTQNTNNQNTENNQVLITQQKSKNKEKVGVTDAEQAKKEEEE